MSEPAVIQTLAAWLETAGPKRCITWIAETCGEIAIRMFGGRVLRKHGDHGIEVVGVEMIEEILELLDDLIASHGFLVGWFGVG